MECIAFTLLFMQDLDFGNDREASPGHGNVMGLTTFKKQKWYAVPGKKSYSL